MEFKTATEAVEFYRAEVERLREALKALVEADEAQLEWEGADPAPADSILGQARNALAEGKVP